MGLFDRFKEKAPNAAPQKDPPPGSPPEPFPPEPPGPPPPAGGVHTAIAAANTRLTAAFPILFLISSAPPLLSPIRCPGRKAAPG